MSKHVMAFHFASPHSTSFTVRKWHLLSNQSLLHLLDPVALCFIPCSALVTCRTRRARLGGSGPFAYIPAGLSPLNTLQNLLNHQCYDYNSLQNASI
eukprot:scaffold500771_cov26-Prasinocladus_malaysianus.AAC.1